jgi:ubiquitin-conjugating enzyme E2 R
MFRRWKDSKGAHKEYENIVRKQVSLSRLEADKDGVQVPSTLSDYCITSKPQQQISEDYSNDNDFFDDDYVEDDDDDDDYIDDDDDDEGDSGHGDA